MADRGKTSRMEAALLAAFLVVVGLIVVTVAFYAPVTPCAERYGTYLCE